MIQLADSTALILGVGDGLEQAIARELAGAGAATLTASPIARGNPEQPETGAPQWHSAESNIDEGTVARLTSFLAEQQRVANVIVAQVDVVEHTADPDDPAGECRHERRPLTSTMLRYLRTVSAATPTETSSSIVLVFRMRQDIGDGDMYWWLERAMFEVASRKRPSSPHTVRVNAVLLGDDDAYEEAAHLIAFLASPVSARISGAFIPIDDGKLLNRGFSTTATTT